ncbi:hypothetical protein KUCAC02_014158 [Chaenocephalus aceratus]|uniref:Uncharacterized protein n=1 Tax=Chaenocephalus aceratus TaxID=36190 RepID=A0ACB9WED0_CHAAC|nr:hypothetical protein KUCAC02_014158 [Chaenocephalus aceratus]
MATSLLGEEPRLGSTPLAMLAATCNKIGSPSPSPSTISDNSVSSFGKGFHPWKRATASSCSLGSGLSGYGVSRNGFWHLGLFLPQHLLRIQCFFPHVWCLARFTLWKRLFCFPSVRFGGRSRQQPPASLYLEGAHLSGQFCRAIYPRMSVAHPYESWFKSSHPGIPTGEVGTTGASAWWDVGTGWIDVQNPNGAALQSSLHSGGTPDLLALSPGRI